MHVQRMLQSSTLLAVLAAARVHAASVTTANQGAGSTGSGRFRSQALRETIDECGDFFGDGSAFDLQVGDGTGSCSDNLDCDNFYTLGNFFEAIDAHNDGEALDNQFPKRVGGSRCLTIAAFLAQTWYESAQFKACKERVQPCGFDPCSPGFACDYQPANQWPDSIVTVPGSNPPSEGPSEGCTDYWGNPLEPKCCWFGRGALQITWLANYNLYLPEYINNPDAICDDGIVGWQASISFWNKNDVVFDGTCESATLVPNPAVCPPKCIADRCEQQHKIEEILQVDWTPAPPPPSSGSHTVTVDEASGGCWGIMDSVCPGQGNNWSANLCTPAHAPNVCPSIFAGDVITYNCNGC